MIGYMVKSPNKPYFALKRLQEKETPNDGMHAYYERARSAKRVSTDIHMYTKNLSMSGRPARRPAGRGHGFERLISLEP